MTTVLSPLESGKFIAENSKDVKIDEGGVKKVAKLIVDCVKEDPVAVHTDRWKTHTLNPKTSDENAIDWIFLSDVGNFSFWSDDENHKYMVRYAGQEWTGYWSWCAAINRALDEGKPVTSAKYLASLTEAELKHVLRSDTDVQIPLLKERLDVLKEAGQVLLEKYDGSFVNVIKGCEKSAQKLLQMVVEDFPSFRDTATFCDKQVAIYKRVQILIADVWACCGGKGFGEFTDIDSITMFADYRIPQALAWFGALKYSEEFTSMMKKGQLFLSGDRMEVEIRGCTIWAIELVREEMRKMLSEEKAEDVKNTAINAIHIDHYLWDYRREHAKETECIPIHHVRCIYY